MYFLNEKETYLSVSGDLAKVLDKHAQQTNYGINDETSRSARDFPSAISQKYAFDFLHTI